MSGGQNKLSLTGNQLKRFNKALVSKSGVQLEFSPSTIKDMIKLGGIFPFLVAIPALIAAATPVVAKAALGAVGTAAGISLKKATGKGYKKMGRGLRLTRTYLGKGLRLPGI